MEETVFIVPPTAAKAQIQHTDVIGLDANALMSNGGAAQSIAFYSADSVFAAFSAARDGVGGLGLSVDGGATWEVKSDFPTGPCRVVTVAEDATSGAKVLYVGTGYGTTTPGRIYRSHNGGATWDSIPGPDAFNSTATGLPIRDIAVRPGSTDTLYIAANDDNLDWAICYSFNGGDSLIPIETEMKQGMEVSSIAINKHHPDSVYFAARTKVLLLDFSEIDTTPEIIDETVTDPPEGEEVLTVTWPQLTDYFEGLPGEIIKDLHFDDLTMTSSVGFFSIKGSGVPVAVHRHSTIRSSRYTSRMTIYSGLRLTVGITLQKPAGVSLRMYSLKGQLLRRIDNPLQREQRHLYSMDTALLPKGMYCLELASGSERLRRTVMLMR